MNASSSADTDTVMATVSQALNYTCDEDQDAQNITLDMNISQHDDEILSAGGEPEIASDIRELTEQVADNNFDVPTSTPIGTPIHDDEENTSA